MSQPSLTNYGLPEAMAAAIRDICRDFAPLQVTTTVSSAELLALNATAKTILAAPSSGFAAVPVRAVIYKPAGVAYAGIAAGEDLVFKYTDKNGAQCTGVIETTGFLDQATAQTRVVGFPGSTGSTAGDVTPAAAAAICLHLLTGEITTGDQPLYVTLFYVLVPTALTA